MDELGKKQLEIMKNATPEQQGNSRRRKYRRRMTRRGGGPIPAGAVCTYPTQAERDAGTETREFEEGEVVCVRSGTTSAQTTGAYVESTGSGAGLKHKVKITAFPTPLSYPWWNVGKYTPPPGSTTALPLMFSFNQMPGTGAAGQGMGTGSQTGPLLASSPGMPSPPTNPDGSLSMLGHSGGKKRKTKKRVTHRR